MSDTQAVSESFPVVPEDRRLPEEEVLKAIKADPRLRILPVTRLTTSDREEDVVRFYNDGASSYIR